MYIKIKVNDNFEKKRVNNSIIMPLQANRKKYNHKATINEYNSIWCMN